MTTVLGREHCGLPSAQPLLATAGAAPHCSKRDPLEA